jgi:hypothetical protein
MPGKIFIQFGFFNMLWRDYIFFLQSNYEVFYLIRLKASIRFYINYFNNNGFCELFC